MSTCQKIKNKKFSIKKLNSAKRGINISKEVSCIILIQEYIREPHYPLVGSTNYYYSGI